MVRALLALVVGMLAAVDAFNKPGVAATRRDYLAASRKAFVATAAAAALFSQTPALAVEPPAVVTDILINKIPFPKLVGGAIKAGNTASVDAASARKAADIASAEKSAEEKEARAERIAADKAARAEAKAALAAK
jgi:hypothetical protein